MPVIEVPKKFTLTLDDHTKKHFEPGRHTVPDEIAEHWYVKAHSTAVKEESAEDATPAASPVENDLANPPSEDEPKAGSAATDDDSEGGDVEAEDPPNKRRRKK